MPTRHATERTLAARLAPWVVTTVTLACASPSRTGPHEMSAAAHEAAAAREELAADVERSRYDPDAWRGRDCRGVRLGERQLVCWSEPRNPTAWHLDDSRRRRELADRHRAASLVLREAEAAACAELAAADRGDPTFMHREDIVRIEPLRKHGTLEGVAVTFRSVPGRSAAGLERRAICHSARSAVLGHERPQSSWCPLAVPEVRVDAVDGPGTVIMRIRTEDEGRAREVLRRTEAVLSSRRPP